MGLQGALEDLRACSLQKELPPSDCAERVQVGTLRVETPLEVLSRSVCSKPSVVPVGTLEGRDGHRPAIQKRVGPESRRVARQETYQADQNEILGL